MSLTEQTRADVVRYRTERASIALDQAKRNLADHCLEVTANRLYYAAYYAVTALLVANRIPTHSHSGCIGQFGRYMVQGGRVSREDGKLLSLLFSLRMTGDYSDRFNLTEEEVLPYVGPTEDFIRRICDMALADILKDDNPTLQ